MKTEELRAHGLTDEQVAFVMAENGKDIGKVQKKLDDLTEEHAKEKQRADTAEETLKKFEGVDVDAIKTELSDWKKKAHDAEVEYNRKIDDRDFEDDLKETVKGYNGLNFKAIRALLDVDALKASKNRKEDMKSAVKALTETEDSKMLFGASDADKTPHFTSVSKGGQDSGVTKESIMAIKDKDERIAAIARNRELFK